MKRLSILVACILSVSLQAQVNLFTENFESGGAGAFTLNTTDLSSQTDATGYNKWIVNNVYTGGSGSITCFGFPIGYTIANTNNQPGGITNSPNSFYMHILSDEAQIDGINCSSYLAADGFCNFAQNHFSGMTGDISTTTYTSVSFSFWWICGGSVNNFGEVYYSTNSGSNWTMITTPISQYSGSAIWQQQTITDPAFDNQPTLRFGFRFVNNQTTAASDPGFSVDDINIVGVFDPNAVTTGTITPANYCAGDSINIPYTETGSYGGGNIFTAELSDDLGSFASPVTLGSLASTASGTINGVIPGGTLPGSGYLVRVVSSSPVIVGSSSSSITISGPPAAAAINTGPYCAGDTIFLVANGGVSYAWAGPNSFTSLQPDPFIGSSISADAGVYTVTVTSAAGCTAISSTTVVVNTNPTPTASNTGPYCVGDNAQLSTAGGVSYAWTGPNSYTSAAQNPSISNIQLVDAGTYTVTVTNADGCTGTATTALAVTVCGSGMEDELLTHVSVYPNPTSDMFTISLNEEMMNKAHISVMNMLGEVVYQITPNQPKLMISSKSLGLRPGIYLVKIQYKEEHQVIRLVVR